ncbi:hypothetical protein AgCh_003299 [Apium graveolens]
MPSEGFLKLFSRKKGIVSDFGVEGGADIGDRKCEEFPEVGVVEKDSKGVVSSKGKEKKQHRDHSSSRTHLLKKYKDLYKVVEIEDNDKASRDLAVMKHMNILQNLSQTFYQTLMAQSESSSQTYAPGQIIFNENNYVNWNRSVMLALGAKNKTSFIDGILLRPTDDSPDLQKWIRNDYMVTGWIMFSIGELWLEIKERYGHSNAPQLYEYHKTLMSIAQNDDSIVDYYNKLKKFGSKFSGSQFTGPQRKDMKDSRKNKLDRFCDFCKMKGHVKEQCFKIIGYPDWYKGKFPNQQTNSKNSDQRFARNVQESFAGVPGHSPPDLTASHSNNFDDTIVGSSNVDSQGNNPALYKEFLKFCS